jgi:hypothetical protein
VLTRRGTSCAARLGEQCEGKARRFRSRCTAADAAAQLAERLTIRVFPGSRGAGLLFTVDPSAWRQHASFEGKVTASPPPTSLIYHLVRRQRARGSAGPIVSIRDQLNWTCRREMVDIALHLPLAAIANAF